MTRINGFIKNFKIHTGCLLCLLLYMQQFQLSYSATIGLKDNFMIDLRWTFLNLMITAVPFFLLLFLLKRVDAAVLVNAVFITILSLINYHVLVFHGSPLLAGDFFSLNTAMNVLSEYYFILDAIVIRLLILFIFEIAIWSAWHVRKAEDVKYRLKRSKACILLLADTAVIFLLFFSPLAIFKGSLITWSWASAMKEYGYAVCFCNSIYSVSHLYSEPEGYSAEKIEIQAAESHLEESNDFPDIILILNETLCDLNVYSEISESGEIFAELENISGLMSGYSVSSLIGGGTNNSEYELLTSNSMAIFNTSAPFISLNMKNSNSIVSYLKKLGYTTIAMHCGAPQNYARNSVFAEMGFDNIFLGKDAFKYHSLNGNREWLDSDNYKDMIEIYEEGDNTPRFLYLLTYQNHGGYEQNDASCDTVKVASDLGNMTDDVNEYLMSVQKSVTAFIDLIEYYENQDREAIILMVGDHAPAFITELPPREELSMTEQELAKRMVPFYVWSNSDIDTSIFGEYAGMTDLIPLLLKSADMPLTAYYHQIVQLHDDVPLRTSTGIYKDYENTVGNIEESMYYDEIMNYYYLEYNNIKHADDYKASWFELELGRSDIK